jgi:hypothetical protein
MTIFEIGIAAIILGIQFIMKLFVGRSPSIPEAIEAVYDLPVDIAFLAASFAAAYCIKSPNGASVGLIHLLVYLLVAVIVVFLSRKSTESFYKPEYTLSAALAVMNYSIAASTLVLGMDLVSRI